MRSKAVFLVSLIALVGLALVSWHLWRGSPSGGPLDGRTGRTMTGTAGAGRRGEVESRVPAPIEVRQPLVRPDSELAPSEGKLLLSCLDRAGVPIAGVKLFVTREGGGDLGVRRVGKLEMRRGSANLETAENGSAELGELPPGDDYLCRVPLGAGKVFPHKIRFAIEAGSVTVLRFVVGTGTEVRGRVPLAAGLEGDKPVKVRLHKHRSPLNREPGGYYEEPPGGVAADEKGAFEIPCTPGQAWLSAGWMDDEHSLFIASLELEVAPGINDVGTLEAASSEPVVLEFVFEGSRGPLDPVRLFPDGIAGANGMLSIGTMERSALFSAMLRVPIDEPLILHGALPDSLRFTLIDWQLPPIAPGFEVETREPTVKADLRQERRVQLSIGVRDEPASRVTLLGAPAGTEFEIALAGFDGRRENHSLVAGRVTELHLPEGRYSYFVTPDQNASEPSAWYAYGELDWVSAQDVVIELQAAASLLVRTEAEKVRVKLEGLEDTFTPWSRWGGERPLRFVSLPPDRKFLVNGEPVTTGPAGSTVELDL